jgi:hypothetical protein
VVTYRTKNSRKIIMLHRHLSSSSLATVLSTSTSNEASNDLYYAVEFIEGFSFVSKKCNLTSIS